MGRLRFAVQVAVLLALAACTSVTSTAPSPSSPTFDRKPLAYTEPIMDRLMAAYNAQSIDPVKGWLDSKMSDPDGFNGNSAHIYRDYGRYRSREVVAVDESNSSLVQVFYRVHFDGVPQYNVKSTYMAVDYHATGDHLIAGWFFCYPNGCAGQFGPMFG